MQGLIAFIFVLGLIVLVHELGHLLSAKSFKVYCKEFAIGMGPKLFSWKGKETTYSLRALPFGGFVSMLGEEGVEAEGIPFERSIKGIARWKQLIVMLAGIVMNFILAFVIILGLHLSTGVVSVNPEPIIAGVLENTPASNAGLQTNDRIVKVTFSDGTSLEPKDFYQVLEALQMYHDTMVFTIQRSNELLEFEVTPQYSQTEERYLIGITIPEPSYVSIHPLESVGYAFSDLASIALSMVTTLSRLVRGIGLDAVSGPVGIYQIASDTAQMGFSSVLYLAAILSLNVAIFNLLPLPIMDGGRSLLLMVEMVTHKPINKTVEQALMLVSMGLLFLLMIWVTTQDLFRLF